MVSEMPCTTPVQNTRVHITLKSPDFGNKRTLGPPSAGISVDADIGGDKTSFDASKTGTKMIEAYSKNTQILHLLEGKHDWVIRILRVRKT